MGTFTRPNEMLPFHRGRPEAPRGSSDDFSSPFLTGLDEGILTGLNSQIVGNALFRVSLLHFGFYHRLSFSLQSRAMDVPFDRYYVLSRVDVNEVPTVVELGISRYRGLEPGGKSRR